MKFGLNSKKSIIVQNLVFHIYHQVSEMFPDSSLLILIGLVIGISLSALKVNREEFFLTEKVFFLYLLPPLVFDAGKINYD